MEKGSHSKSKLDEGFKKDGHAIDSLYIYTDISTLMCSPLKLLNLYNKPCRGQTGRSSKDELQCVTFLALKLMTKRDRS